MLQLTPKFGVFTVIMGRFEIQSETVFDYEREIVWDFATNPNNWVSVFV